MTTILTELELATMMKRAETVKQAQKEAGLKGWQLLEVKFFDHKDDAHLLQVSVMRDTTYKPYATLEFNADSNAFYWGHYDFKTLEDARADLEQR